MRGRKKGQMEIMGLVVIVILITLGLLFLVYFSAKNEIEKKVFTRKGLALSTMSALMKTTVNSEIDCTTSISLSNQPQLGEDILEDCALYYSDYFVGAGGSSGAYSGASSGASGGVSGSSSGYLSEGEVDSGAMSLYGCESKHSCHFFQETTEKLLEDTLGKWGKRYEFRAHLLSSVSEEKLFLLKDKSGQGCKGERDSSGQFPIQIKDTGVVEAELYVCE